MTLSPSGPPAGRPSGPAPGAIGLFPGFALGSVLGLGLLDQQVVTPLIAALARGLDASVPEVGFAISAYAVFASSSALFTGPLSDRRGRRPFLLAAAALMLGASLLTALSADYGAFVAARAAAGVAGGAIAAIAVAWVADRVPYARRGRVMAALVGGGMGAAALGQVGAAFAAGRFGHRAVYLGLALFSGLVFLLLAALREDAAPRRGTPEGREPAADGGGAASPEGVAGWLRGYADFAGSAPHRTTALAAFCLSGSLVGVTAYASGWLQEARGFSLEEVGLIYGAFGLAILVVQPLAGPLSDRFGKRRFGVAASVAAALLTLALPAFRGPALVAALVLFGCLAVSRVAAFAALRSELVRPSRRAAFLAFSNTSSQLGIAAAAALGGVFYRSGFSAVCWAMAGFGGLAAFFIARIPEPGAAGADSAP